MIVAVLGLPGSTSMEWVVLSLLVIAGYLQWFKLIPLLGRSLRALQVTAGPRLRGFISLFDPILPNEIGNRILNSERDISQDPEDQSVGR